MHADDRDARERQKLEHRMLVSNAVGRRARGVELTPDQRAAEARDRATKIRTGITQLDKLRQMIADAYTLRDWVELGYEDWAAYCRAEFGVEDRRLTPEARKPIVGFLNAQGMSGRAIAAALGVSEPTVRREVRHHDAPEIASAKIVGQDGKSYPARIEAPQPEPCRAPLASATVERIEPVATSTNPLWDAVFSKRRVVGRISDRNWLIQRLDNVRGITGPMAADFWAQFDDQCVADIAEAMRRDQSRKDSAQRVTVIDHASVGS
jgi:hypothetical protein